MEIRKTIKRKFAVMIFFSGVLLPLPLHSGSLQNQMDKVFDEMTNTTPPGVYKTQSRGVISGGRYLSKSKIFNEDVISFDPPSFKAGCGGIDFYAGSLSFIDGQKIVELLRAIASNAKGYAFQIALSAISPEIAIWMENMQKKIQQLSEALGNSCQLAKGLVNATGFGDAKVFKHEDDTSLSATFDGFFNDPFDGRDQGGGESAAEKVKANNHPSWKDMHGNILWQVFKKQNVSGWFKAPADEKMLRTIMSITGTVVIGDITHEEVKNGKDGDASQKKIQAPKQKPTTLQPMLTLSDFVEGNVAGKIYKCESTGDQCMDAMSTDTGKSKETVSVPSIADKIAKAYLGPGGIIEKIAFNQGALTGDQQKIQASLLHGIGGMIFTLSNVSQQSAEGFIRRYSRAIALELTYNMVEQYLDVAAAAIGNSKSAYKEDVMAQIDAAQKKIDGEYLRLIKVYGDVVSAHDSYAVILSNLKKHSYKAPSRGGR